MASKTEIKEEEVPVHYACGKWIVDDNRTWYQRQATEILKKGPIPNHVAFILDGNRTFARASRMRAVEGHKKGLTTFSNVILWCRKFGVREVTGYIFSIENFKRPKAEINDLMRLAKEAFVRLLNEVEELNANGWRVRMVGDWSMVPKDLIAILSKIMILTRHNDSGILNLAFAYTGRNEITRTANELTEGVQRGDLKVEDLNVTLADEALKIVSVQSPPDLLIRTSGVTRLSDFLIWQSTFTILHFIDALWPELTFWDIWKSMFQYQVQYFRMQKYKLAPAEFEKKQHGEISERGHTFLRDLEDRFWDHVQMHADKL